MTQHALSRRGLVSRAFLAIAGGAVAPQAIEKATTPAMTLEEARKAFPVTAAEARMIAYQALKDDGPLLAADRGGRA